MARKSKNNALIESLALGVLSEALSGSPKGKRLLRESAKLLGKSPANLGGNASSRFMDNFFGIRSSPSANSFSGSDGLGNDFASALLQAVAIGLFKAQRTRTTSAESERSRNAQTQWDAFRLSKGQRAVMLAEIIRRAERNL